FIIARSQSRQGNTLSQHAFRAHLILQTLFHVVAYRFPVGATPTQGSGPAHGPTPVTLVNGRVGDISILFAQSAVRTKPDSGKSRAARARFHTPGRRSGKGRRSG